MAFRIYPSIGVARVGNDLTQFYIGSEIPGHPGFDIDDQGNENLSSSTRSTMTRSNGRPPVSACSR